MYALADQRAISFKLGWKKTRPVWGVFFPTAPEQLTTMSCRPRWRVGELAPAAEQKVINTFYMMVMMMMMTMVVVLVVLMLMRINLMVVVVLIMVVVVVSGRLVALGPWVPGSQGDWDPKSQGPWAPAPQGPRAPGP